MDLKRNHPDEWQKAVEFDRAIRNMSNSGVRNPVFLHRSLLPLDKVDFEGRIKAREEKLARKLDPNGSLQLRLFDEGFQNECEGVCGV